MPFNCLDRIQYDKLIQLFQEVQARDKLKMTTCQAISIQATPKRRLIKKIQNYPEPSRKVRDGYGSKKKKKWSEKKIRSYY